MPAEDNDRTCHSCHYMPDYSAGGLLIADDQAVLPLNVQHGSASASVSHADAATEQGDRHTDSVIMTV